jgi:hypothetical protein
MKYLTLAAFSAERRIAAIVLFRGRQVEAVQVRHLPLDPVKASGSVRQLLTRTLEHYCPQFVAISLPSEKAGERVHILNEIAREIASELGVPATEVSNLTLRAAYGHPPLSRKEHVRKAGRTIWPSLNDGHTSRSTLDAATVGLYVQTERLLSAQEVVG